jgi:DNA polymerase-3 subunit alpha
MHEEKVRVAGLITAVRPYTTKTNKPMGFVTIEDIQGNIELVLFPKTWQKFHEQLSVGQIVIIEGKADTGSTPPKILVDEIRTEIKILEPLASSLPVEQPAPLAGKPTPDPVAQAVAPAMQLPKQNAASQKSTPVKPSASQPPPARKVAEPKGPVYSIDPEFDDMPPPPDNFPDDWDTQWQPSFEQASIAARPEPKVNETPIDESPKQSTQTQTAEPEIPVKEREQVQVGREAIVVQQISSTPVESHDFLPSLYIPLAQEETDQEHAPQQITVVLRSTGDKERDRRRIKSIFGTLISFPGRDRFSFQIFEDGKGHLIDFPNDTTRVCKEVLDRLKKLMGEESWRVEEITFL